MELRRPQIHTITGARRPNRFALLISLLSCVSTVTLGTACDPRSILMASTPQTATVPSSFTLSISPNSLTFGRGADKSTTVTINSQNGFTGNVALSASGLSKGMLAEFSPALAGTQSTLNLAATDAATPGVYEISIVGVAGSLEANSTVTIAVLPSPTFSLSASPDTLTFDQGAGGTTTITVEAHNGFKENVSLYATGLPKGVSASFSTDAVVQESVLTLTSSDSAIPGHYTVTLTGVASDLEEITSISLTILPPPSFSLSASPNILTLSPGASGSATITVTAISGFSGLVSLSADSLPNGVRIAFSPVTTETASTVNLTVSETAIAGTYKMAVVGVAGGIQVTAVITLTIPPPPGFNLFVTPNSLSFASGASGLATITVGAQNGFKGNVSLSATGLPPGVLVMFAPEVTEAQSTLTFASSAIVAAGVYKIVINGTDGTVHASTAFSLDILPSPNFGLTVSPTSLMINQWVGGSTTITVGEENGFTGNVSLSTTGLPSGVYASLTQTIAGQQSVLALTSTDTVVSGAYPITIVGTSGDLRASTTFTATVLTSPVLRGSDAYCDASGNWIGARLDSFAEAPRTCFDTDLADTPGSGATYLVQPGDNLAAALNSAQCGDTVELQEGASFPSGSLAPAPKNCPDTAWITVRTSAPDSALPPEHSRANPSYAGIPSLPGRPPFSGGTGDAMAQIVLNSPTGTLVPGDHFRLIGLEITRPSDGTWHNALVNPQYSKNIFDRCWVHGDAVAETGHLVQIAPSADHIAVIDSYLSDAHCTAVTGACSDAQAITATGGAQVTKIYDDFLEASGESVMFGGGAASTLTADLEIRLNHFFKPMIWNRLDPSFFGTTFIVKNNLELKEGQRIFVEGNTLENDWGGFSQSGANILLTPKNQAGANGTNLCPICLLSDVTLRYNYVRHGAMALVIGDGESDNHGWPAGSFDYSIHDMIFDGMQYAECSGCGYFLSEIGSGYDPENPPPTVLHNLSLNHITVVNAGFLAPVGIVSGLVEMGGPPENNSTSTPQIANLAWTNSIMATGSSGAYPTGGGTANCAVGEKTPATEFAACWEGDSSFAGNVLVVDPNTTNALVWPGDNQSVSDWMSVGFINFNNGDGGNYALDSSSPYKGTALDGLDPGANTSVVMEPAPWVQ